MSKKENILIVHNRYQISGGEDTVVENEIKLLETHGHQVFLYVRDNSELSQCGFIQKLLLPFRILFSRESYRQIRSEIKKHQIDVVHVHNTILFISFSAYYAAKREGCKLVQTLHNFRFVCVNGMMYRDNHICDECIQNGSHKAIVHKCYRNSKIQTILLTFMFWLHKKLHTFDLVDAYISLTDFNRKTIGKAIDTKKIVTRSNYVLDPELPVINAKERKYFVYVARLEVAKGIFVLLDAFREITDERLLIIGDGPAEAEALAYIEKYQMKHVELVGRIEHNKVLEYLAGAKALIFPTQWYEGMPMTLIESFAVGTPVIVSDVGNAASMVEEEYNGVHFQYNSVLHLKHTVKKFIDFGITKQQKMICQARETYLQKYTSEKSYDRLMRVYRAELGNEKEKNIL